ncbi:HAD family hydrolase [Photobacterium nomapromontoriensis]|uniref:HAD family hydrolase n=1 Tax=Photobacterium nomapromontoriensis TaxID=2910237 RepID=UPI003D0C0156
MGMVYLFDWGDTLMVDFPDVQGKMCNWHTVEAVDGAKETLAALAQQGYVLYVATGADDSSEQDIKRAFERVGLACFISGYFCRANIGLAKGSAAFYQRIVTQLGIPPTEITMVGDSLVKDVIAAQEAGLHAVWFNPRDARYTEGEHTTMITQLVELIG